MSCILRIYGKDLDVDSLLANIDIAHDRFWKKGDPRTANGSKFYSDSGVNLIASEGDLDQFGLQIKDATAFLRLHGTAISKIVSFPGVENAVLDFGVALNEGCVAQYSYLPPDFIRLAAASGIGVEISHYACSKDDGS